VYRPVIPAAVGDRIRHLSPDLKRGIREAIRAISADPARGESLERELGGYRKYRVRRYRIIYKVDRAARTVRILAVGHRRTIYEEVAERVRTR